jgi:hypothetical protein
MSLVRFLILSLALAALLAGPALAQDAPDPAEEPGVPAEEPGVPAEEPGVPAEEPGVPAEEPAAPSDIDVAIDDMGSEGMPNPWSGSVELGATYTSGNSDRLVFSGLAQAARETPTEKLEAKLSTLYGEDSRIRSINEQILTLRGEWKFHPAYAFLQLVGERDEFEEIDWRVIIAPGAGYWFVNDDRTQVKAEVGPAYTYEDYMKPRLPLGVDLTSLSPGERTAELNDLNARKADYQEKEGKLQARISVFAFQKVFDDASITEEIEYYPEIGDPDSFRLISTTTFEQPLSEAWFWKLQIINEYNTPVAKDVDRHDFKAIMALVLKF